MGAVTAEEVASLQREFDWVLTTEVDNVTRELKAAVTECANKFPIQVGDLNSEKSDYPSSDKFVLASGEQVKVIVTLSGDAISGADINLKLPRPHAKDAYHNTTVREDLPWKLQQVQDAANHLQLVMEQLSTLPEQHKFSSADEVSHFLSTIMESLLRARQALVVPKKRTLEELVNSKNVKSLVPALPREVAVSFYLQSWKLIFAVYHMVTDKGVSRFDRYQAECVVPWVNDVLLLLTVSLQTAQQLRDKLDIFKQYKQEIRLSKQ